ncbi:MAG: EAL domain-containing protein, partial [Chloroflexi bacterium]|nr:EAL domain-containing protein [Chloroflexota bacterium]
DFPSHAPLTIGVNLSARQALEPSLVHDVASILAETGLAPGRLKLEVTESLALDPSNTTTETLLTLGAMGVCFAIDDFGTGQAGLSYLRRFRVSTLKLDQSFVRGMLDNQDDAAFVRGVLALAHAVGLEVTAEGIEHAAQAHALRTMGCDTGQGYYFARPAPPEAIAAVILGAPHARAA